MAHRQQKLPAESHSREPKLPSAPEILTLPPEAEAPFSRGNLSIPVGVAGVEIWPDADLVFVQVDGSQLGLIQVKVVIGVELGEHPTYGVLTAGDQAPVQHCRHKLIYSYSANSCTNNTYNIVHQIRSMV